MSHILIQKKRLKMEVPRTLAEQAELSGWDRVLPRGWFNYDDSLYWYVPDRDDAAYRGAAEVVRKLYAL